MDNFEIDKALTSMALIVDTREQQTPRLFDRLAAAGCPYERRKLNFGDYSAFCHTEDGELDLSDVCVIERKLSLDELCACYCGGRGRFAREFERARLAGAKIYMLVEDASWEAAYKGAYRSRMRPESLVASLLAWLARYDCQLIFCSPKTTGRLIRDILYRELKERLEGNFDGKNRMD